MSNHDAVSQAHHLRGAAANMKPLAFVVTPDDLVAMREAGHSDAEIQAAITMLAPHLEQAARLLPGALLRRAETIEGGGR